MTERLAGQRLRSPETDASARARQGRLDRLRGGPDEHPPNAAVVMTMCPLMRPTPRGSARIQSELTRSVSGTLWSITNLRLRPLNIPVTSPASGGLAGALRMLRIVRLGPIAV